MKRKSSFWLEGRSTSAINIDHDMQNEAWNRCETKQVLKKGTKHVWFILRRYDSKENKRQQNDNNPFVWIDGEKGISAWLLYLDKELTLRKIAEAISEIPYVLRDITADPRSESMQGRARINSIHSDQDVDGLFLNYGIANVFVIALDFIQGPPQAGPSASLPLRSSAAAAAGGVKRGRPKKKQKNWK